MNKTKKLYSRRPRKTEKKRALMRKRKQMGGLLFLPFLVPVVTKVVGATGAIFHIGASTTAATAVGATAVGATTTTTAVGAAATTATISGSLAAGTKAFATAAVLGSKALMAYTTHHTVLASATILGLSLSAGGLLSIKYVSDAHINMYYNLLVLTISRMNSREMMDKMIENKDKNMMQVAEEEAFNSNYIVNLKKGCMISDGLIKSTLKLNSQSYNVYEVDKRYICCRKIPKNEKMEMDIHQFIGIIKSFYITEIFNIIADNYDKNKELYKIIAGVDVDKIDYPTINRTFKVFDKTKWPSGVDYDTKELKALTISFYKKQVDIIKYIVAHKDGVNKNSQESLELNKVGSILQTNANKLLELPSKSTKPNTPEALKPIIITLMLIIDQ